MTMLDMLNVIQSLLVLCTVNSEPLDRVFGTHPNIFHTLSRKKDKNYNQIGLFLCICCCFPSDLKNNVGMHGLTSAKYFPYSLYALQNACRLIFCSFRKGKHCGRTTNKTV